MLAKFLLDYVFKLTWITCLYSWMFVHKYNLQAMAILTIITIKLFTYFPIIMKCLNSKMMQTVSGTNRVISGQVLFLCILLRAPNIQKDRPQVHCPRMWLVYTLTAPQTDGCPSTLPSKLPRPLAQYRPYKHCFARTHTHWATHKLPGRVANTRSLPTKLPWPRTHCPSQCNIVKTGHTWPNNQFH